MLRVVTTYAVYSIGLSMSLKQIAWFYTVRLPHTHTHTHTILQNAPFGSPIFIRSSSFLNTRTLTGINFTELTNRVKNLPKDFKRILWHPFTVKGFFGKHARSRRVFKHYIFSICHKSFDECQIQISNHMFDSSKLKKKKKNHPNPEYTL